MKRLLALISIVLFLIVAINYPHQKESYAQEDGTTTCSAFTNEAIRRTRQLCTGLSRGNACYGNNYIEAQPQPGHFDFRFETPGDVSDVAAIKSLQLNGLNETEMQWGIALMELQANIPRASPESVSIVLFGSVRLENAGISQNVVEVVLDKQFGVDLRTEAGYGGAIAYTAAVGDALLAYERNEASTWLRVEVPESGEIAWVNAASVVSNANLRALPVATEETFYQPMQAVYLSSNGSSESACTNFPTDGMLIQTPEGIAEVTLMINEVIIELGSTALIEVNPTNVMTISLLEGHSRITSMGVHRELPAGFSTSIILDENLRPTTAPSTITTVDPGATLVLSEGPGTVLGREQIATIESSISGSGQNGFGTSDDDDDDDDNDGDDDDNSDDGDGDDDDGDDDDGDDDNGDDDDGDDDDDDDDDDSDDDDDD